MSEYPTFKQWRFGAYRKFEFKPDKLIYCARDHSGECEYSTPYESIQILEPGNVTTKSQQFVRKLFGIPIVLFLVATAVSQYSKTLASVLGWSAGLMLV